MRLPKSRLGWIDVVFVCVGVVFLVVVGNLDVKLNDSFVPTAVNGISTATGVMISLASVLVVFSMNQLRGGFLSRYRGHMVGSILGLVVSAFVLVMAYVILVQGNLAPAVRWAMLGLVWAVLVMFEYLMFLITRIFTDMGKC